MTTKLEIEHWGQTSIVQVYRQRGNVSGHTHRQFRLVIQTNNIDWIYLYIYIYIYIYVFIHIYSQSISESVKPKLQARLHSFSAYILYWLLWQPISSLAFPPP